MAAYDDRAIYDGIKAYSAIGLRVYDTVVMRVLAKHVWGCEPSNFVDFYRHHVSDNHADIGVGTGYCLDRCSFDTPSPRLALIDLREDCLNYAARRLQRFAPEAYRRNAIDPIHIGTRRFDSVALGGLIHCLPGTMSDKGRVFDALAPILGAGAKVFGYSLVADRVDVNRRRQLVHACLNRLRVVNDRDDRMADLAGELHRRFDDCRLEMIGCFAFFSAVAPGQRTTPRAF